MKRMALSFAILMAWTAVSLAQAPVDLRPDIYSKLKCCACKIDFAPCGCKEAVEMKAYIEGLIESGVSRDDIFYRVTKKFSLKVILDEQIKTEVRQRLIKEADGKLPQIVLETSSFDFGKISKKQGRVVKVFKLYNKGNSDLIITNIRVSCSCVTASLRVGKNKSPAFGVMGARDSGWQQVIKQGQYGELEVVLDMAHSSMKAGSKEVRDIFIASNDPLNSHATLRVEVNVIE